MDELYDSGFVKKLETIADEAEVCMCRFTAYASLSPSFPQFAFHLRQAVALELAGGRELSAKEAQDMAWERQTVSVWELEQVA